MSSSRPDEADSPTLLVMACRPVDSAAMDQEVLELGIEMPPVYPGSVVRRCAQCGAEVYVGPKLQSVEGGVPFCLFPCAMDVTASTGGAIPLINMGNPYQRRGAQ